MVWKVNAWVGIWLAVTRDEVLSCHWTRFHVIRKRIIGQATGLEAVVGFESMMKAQFSNKGPPNINFLSFIHCIFHSWVLIVQANGEDQVFLQKRKEGRKSYTSSPDRQLRKHLKQHSLLQKKTNLCRS